MKKVAIGVVVVILVLPLILKTRTHYEVEPGKYVEGGDSVRVHSSVLGRGGFLFEFPLEQVIQMKELTMYAGGLASNPKIIVAANEEEAARLRAREALHAPPRVTTSERKVSRQGGVISEKKRTTGGIRKVVVAPRAVIEKTLANGLTVNITPTHAALIKTVKKKGKTHTVEVRWEEQEVVSVTLNGKPIEKG